MRDLTRSTSKIVNQVADSGEGVVVTKQGIPVVLVEPISALEQRALTLERSPELASQIRRSRAERERGETFGLEELDRQLEAAAGESAEGREVLAARLEALESERASLSRELDRLFSDMTRLADIGSELPEQLLAMIKATIGGAIEGARSVSKGFGADDVTDLVAAKPQGATVKAGAREKQTAGSSTRALKTTGKKRASSRGQAKTGSGSKRSSGTATRSRPRAAAASGRRATAKDSTRKVRSAKSQTQGKTKTAS